MKKILLVLAIIVMSSFAFASGEEICNYFIEEKGITANGFEVPSFIPYKNDVLNAYTSEGEIAGHVSIEKGVITSIGCDLAEDPDFVVTIKDLDVVKGIYSAESKADAMNQALKNKEITIEGQSMGKKVKGFFTKVGIKIASWFT